MKKVKTITIILSIVLITMVAFFGVYVQKQNRMENQVKEYELSTDFEGTRTLRLKVSDETEEIIKDKEGNTVSTEEDLTDEQLKEKGYTKEKQAYNAEDKLNLENYKKSKEIIENRLNNLGVTYYEIALDEENGDIVIQIPEASQTDDIVSNISAEGKFEVKDRDTKELLMDNNDIKLANVLYGSSGTNGNETAIYLNIEFTKEGAKKLEEISTTYVPAKETDEEESTEETEATETEETETAENTEEVEKEETESTETEENKEKVISMQVNDEEIMSTSFEQPIKTGRLQLTVGTSSSNEDKIRENIQRATQMANILDNGKMPVKYELEENKYLLSDIAEENLLYINIAIAIIGIICVIIFTIRFKMTGLLGAISTVGFAAIYILAIKYTDVTLSLTSLFGMFVTLLLNIILVKNILLKNKNTKLPANVTIKEAYKEFFLKLIPICISVIAFCFTSWAPISSFGMIMFWGIALSAIYNYIITNTIFKLKADK